MGHVRAHIGIQGIHHPDGEAVRNGIRLVPVGIHGAGVPALGEHAVGGYQARVLHISVSAVAIQDNLDTGIAGIKGVSVRG
jgi:hypothetical protein